MSTGQRIVNVLTGLVMIALSILMIADTGLGITVAAAILSISLTVYGVRYLFYYFTMARHMVGGKLLLYVGIIVLDLGAFTGTLVNTSRFYVILYLLGAHAFSGAIDVLRGLEAKRGGSPSWKLSIAHGAVNIAVALACMLFLRTPSVPVYVYAAGLMWSALLRVVSAFRRTAIVYVQ